MGPLIPLFWTSGDVCPGFQSQGGSPACFLTWVILRFTSGATPTDCIGISMVAEPFQSTYFQTCPCRGSNPWPSVPHAAQCCKPFGHSGSAKFLFFVFVYFKTFTKITDEGEGTCVLLQTCKTWDPCRHAWFVFRDRPTSCLLLMIWNVKKPMFQVS